MHPIAGPRTDSHLQPARLDWSCSKTPMLRKGMVVTLNTGDTARVESLAPDAPDKPIVVILRDRTGQAVKPRIVIDLRSQPDVYLVAVAPPAPAK